MEEEESFEEAEEEAENDVYELDGDNDDNEEFRALDEMDDDEMMNSDPDTFDSSKGAIFVKPPCITQSFESHTQGVLNLGLNPMNNSEFISGGLDDKLCLWNMGSANPLVTHSFSDSVSLVEFGFDGKLLAAACLDNSIKVFENNASSNYKERFNLQGVSDEITVFLSVDGVPQSTRPGLRPTASLSVQSPTTRA